jgi:hypothetical protein
MLFLLKLSMEITMGNDPLNNIGVKAPSTSTGTSQSSDKGFYIMMLALIVGMGFYVNYDIQQRYGNQSAPNVASDANESNPTIDAPKENVTNQPAQENIAQKAVQPVANENVSTNTVTSQVSEVATVVETAAAPQNVKITPKTVQQETIAASQAAVQQPAFAPTVEVSTNQSAETIAQATPAAPVNAEAPAMSNTQTITEVQVAMQEEVKVEATVTQEAPVTNQTVQTTSSQSDTTSAPTVENTQPVAATATTPTTATQQASYQPYNPYGYQYQYGNNPYYYQQQGYGTSNNNYYNQGYYYPYGYNPYQQAPAK